MEIIQPRNLQLLSGTDEREAALVNSVEELKQQMNLANNEAKLKRNKLVVLTSIISVAVIFLSGVKLHKMLKILGTLLSIGALINGAMNMKSVVKELPRSDEFSAIDRAYSYFNKVTNYSSNDSLVQKAVKAALDVMIKLKMIKPFEVEVKKDLLKANKINIKNDVKLAIIDYKYNGK